MSTTHTPTNPIIAPVRPQEHCSPAIPYGDLIGKPFGWGERGPHAFDCYGLVYFLLRRSGVKVPDYPSCRNGALNALQIIDAMQEWDGQAEPSVGCVVALRMELRVSTHCGLIVAPDLMAHVMEKISVATERLSSPLWKNRVIGYYKWPS